MASSVGSMAAEGKFNKPLLVDNVKKLVDAIKKEKLELADIKKKLRLLSFVAVLFVSLWAFLSACFLGVFSAYNIFGPRTSHQQCLESKTCYLLPCAVVAEVDVILSGLLCCSVLQAAAAVLALLLTSRRRRDLAYAAVAATTAGHFMYGRIHWILAAAYPGDTRIVPNIQAAIIGLVIDLLCFLDLILVLVDDGEMER